MSGGCYMMTCVEYFSISPFAIFIFPTSNHLSLRLLLPPPCISVVLVLGTVVPRGFVMEKSDVPMGSSGLT